MHFSASIITTLLAFANVAITSPIEPRETLQDWKVTKVDVFTPSGRPGSYPWATLTANVSDPNSINLGKAADNTTVIIPPSQGSNCVAKWFTRGNNEVPTGRTWPCDPVDDQFWTMTVLPGTNGFSPTDFKLRFDRVLDVYQHGSQFTPKYEAEGSFKVGDNMSGVCGGSGVCSWGLKAAVSIKPKKVTK